MYKITYELKFGDDGVKAFDEVYFNIIGDAWHNITFSLTLPKQSDAKKVGFSIGNKGTVGYGPSLLSLKSPTIQFPESS